jgi:hypothetical protein
MRLTILHAPLVAQSDKGEPVISVQTERVHESPFREDW